MGVRHETYWLGFRSGKVLAQDPNHNYEGELKLNVALHQAPTNPARAFALGELRGYRLARDERPVVTDVEGWKRNRLAELQRIAQQAEHDQQAGAMRAADAGAWEER